MFKINDKVTTNLRVKNIWNVKKNDLVATIIGMFKGVALGYNHT